MTDHDKEAREAMAIALCEAEGGRPMSLTTITHVFADSPPPDGFDDKGLGGYFYWSSWLNKVDQYTSADPLRRLLGTKAVEALLAGKAAVVAIIPEVWGRQPEPGHVWIADETGLCVERPRLDYPGEAA